LFESISCVAQPTLPGGCQGAARGLPGGVHGYLGNIITNSVYKL